MDGWRIQIDLKRASVRMLGRYAHLEKKKGIDIYILPGIKTRTSR